MVRTGTRVALLPQDVPEDIEGPVSQVVAQGFHGEQERTEAWKVEQQVKQVLSRTGLDGGLLFEQLSSGMKRRVLLARTLVTSPDVLLLDEPTNHLDIGMITWLEEFLLKWEATLLFVTHDRMF